MVHKLSSRMQFLLDCLTTNQVKPTYIFKYIKTKEFKAKCKIYKYRFSDRDIKTLYSLNCLPALQSETKLEVKVDANVEYEIDSEPLLVNTYKLNKEKSESKPKSSLEFNPNIYTLCGIYLTIIVAFLYFIYEVFL